MKRAVLFLAFLLLTFPAFTQIALAQSQSASATFTLVVKAQPITITTVSVPNGVVGTAYSQSLAATGGAGGFTWSVTAGSLPSGLTLASSGTISGTPTATGTFNFTAQVKDSVGTTASQVYTVSIASPLTITTTSIPDATVGVAYTFTLQASGGTAPYTWSISSGTLPAGLTINSSTGVISGTPTTAGSSTITFKITDAGK